RYANRAHLDDNSFPSSAHSASGYKPRHGCSWAARKQRGSQWGRVRTSRAVATSAAPTVPACALSSAPATPSRWRRAASTPSRWRRCCWVLYERPNYTGSQYVLSPGEYADPHQWRGFSVSIMSCRFVKNVYGKSWKIRFYGKKDFGGQAAECAEDCESVYEASFQFREALSSVAADGARVLYEQPDHRGRQYFRERGEYRGYTDRGATSPPLWGPSA
uniref:Beta/gamma crystallin 'Greek key' domain-containing protein n=1 Tax=Gasterosteus aculeatus aculeatus TaxID=481459 RepID=A0AAQ4Q5S0_GASAC